MWQSRAYLAKLYALNGHLDKIEPLINTLSAETCKKILLAVAQDCSMNQQFEPAEDVLNLALRKYPASFPALNNLIMVYYQKGDTALVESAIAKFRKDNAQNVALMNSVDDLIKRMKSIPVQTSEVK